MTVTTRMTMTMKRSGRGEIQGLESRAGLVQSPTSRATNETRVDQSLIRENRYSISQPI